LSVVVLDAEEVALDRLGATALDTVGGGISR
jgi:hypothetical protein